MRIIINPMISFLAQFYPNKMDANRHHLKVDLHEFTLILIINIFFTHSDCGITNDINVHIICDIKSIQTSQLEHYFAPPDDFFEPGILIDAFKLVVLIF
jgi:hypothetical protein